MHNENNINLKDDNNRNKSKLTLHSAHTALTVQASHSYDLHPQHLILLNTNKLMISERSREGFQEGEHPQTALQQHQSATMLLITDSFILYTQSKSAVFTFVSAEIQTLKMF